MKKSYRKIKRKTRTLPLLLTIVRGAIGKQYVIKHYRYGVIKTKYPDMTNIVASARQRSCRDLFKEAVAHAKKVYADPVQKAAWKKKVRKKHLAFNYIIKDYMLAENKAAKQRQLTGKYLLRSCFEQVATGHNRPEAEKTGTIPAMLTATTALDMVYRE